MKTVQKIHSSTQKFTGIKDIVENAVLLSDGNACSVIEIEATNFSLLSTEEQKSKIFSYASLLNSLSFPVQIIIRNKRIDISNYLKLLDLEALKTQNQKLSAEIKLYKEFVGQLIKENMVLDKKFYMAISYSYLEKSIKKNDKEFAEQAKQALRVKVESLSTQLARLNLRAKVLGKEALAQLFYEIFNDGYSKETPSADVGTPVVLGK